MAVDLDVDDRDDAASDCSGAAADAPENAPAEATATTGLIGQFGFAVISADEKIKRQRAVAAAAALRSQPPRPSTPEIDTSGDERDERTEQSHQSKGVPGWLATVLRGGASRDVALLVCQGVDVNLPLF